MSLISTCFIPKNLVPPMTGGLAVDRRYVKLWVLSWCASYPTTALCSVLIKHVLRIRKESQSFNSPLVTTALLYFIWLQCYSSINASWYTTTMDTSQSWAPGQLSAAFKWLNRQKSCSKHASETLRLWQFVCKSL